jgi:NAD(P)-dependent dehydrogenase (short-subunit alcohol dehydrogenase family)
MPAGYRVAVLDAKADAAQAVASELGNAMALTCDVTDEHAVDAALGPARCRARPAGEQRRHREVRPPGRHERRRTSAACSTST